MDKKLIVSLYKKAQVLEPQFFGIVNHMFGVAHVAKFMASKINKIDIDLELIENAALLHDIGKKFDMSPMGHTIAGVEFLNNNQVDERIIQIVQRHQIWVFSENEMPEPETWEEKLVFFGDLSFSSQYVPFEERVEELVQRFQLDEKQTSWLRTTSKNIHKEFLLLSSK